MGTITTLTRNPEPPPRPALRTVPPAADAAQIDLSIAIVTWNSERWIDRCLRAIPPACEGIAYEIVLNDNASGDRTLQRVDAGAVQILRADRNLGFAAGMNRAIAATRGRYVFLLNPDCELAPRALTLLFEFLEANPDVAAAAPLLTDESGRSQREFQLRRLPTLRTFVHEVLLLDKMFPTNGATAHYRYRDLDLDRPNRIEQPAAAALLIRRKVFEEVGPLDERFEPAWFEDVDYCHRLALAGKEVYAVPAAWARHFGGASLEHISFGDFTDVWYRNMMRYAAKWWPAGQVETLRWVILLGMLLRIPAALLGFGHPDLSRWETTRAYLRVLEKAFKRWGGSSQSSS
jgi:GT2 family glycosyltransferase